MSDLRDLYQELILDHGKHPRHFGAPERCTHTAHGENPLCGDKVVVYLEVVDGRIVSARFSGSGCAISTASASLMSEAVAGLSPTESIALFERFHALVTGETETLGDERFEKLDVFAGVSEFPVRVKCASLPWHTLKAALDRRPEPISTE